MFAGNVATQKAEEIKPKGFQQEVISDFQNFETFENFRK